MTNVPHDYDPLSGLRRPFITPLIEVNLFGASVKMKMECENPSGSHKDRPAQAKVDFYRRVQHLGHAATVFILSSSGNTGVAFATYLASIPNVRLIVVADVLSPEAHLVRLRRFPHVQLIVIDDPDSTGSHLTARLEAIKDLRKRYPQAEVIDQYGDPIFPLAYEATLADEIEAQVGGPIAAVILAAGTCGTILGFDYRKRSLNRHYKIIPVDAEGSRLFFNDNPGKRLFPGYGNARPTHYAQQTAATSPPIVVDNLSVARMARWLLIRHGLLVGASSAAVAAANVKVLSSPDYGGIPHSGDVVLVMPDGGENYRDTLHDDDWLIDNGLGKSIMGP